MTEEIQSIEQRIAEAVVAKAALEAQLEQRIATARMEFVGDVVKSAEALGLSADDLICALGGKRKTRVTQIKPRKPRTEYALKSDPGGPRYKGGRFPAWLEDKMSAEGYNPRNKEARKLFVSENMQAA